MRFIEWLLAALSNYHDIVNESTLAFLQRCLLLVLQCVQSQEHLKGERTEGDIQQDLKTCFSWTDPNVLQ